MDRLPYEIQIDIFNRLSFKDKLQCALICHTWYNKISSTVLYTTVRLNYRRNDPRTTVVIQYMKDKGVGAQTKNLNMTDFDNPLELSALFPNLKSSQVDAWCSNDEWSDSDELNNCNNASLAKNWQNLKVIDEDDYILTMKLLGTPLHMRSLTSLTLNFEFMPKKTLMKFIDQVKHLRTLNHLCLVQVFVLTYNKLDLLHKSTANLQCLESMFGRYLFVESKSMEEYRPLSIDSSVASNLRSLKIAFDIDNSLYIEEDWKEINDVHCIEYVCRKYPNLDSIALWDVDTLQSQNSKNITTEYLWKAFRSWAQLKKFDIRPVHLSASILQAMDDCNIRLEELKLYIDDNDIYTEQLIHLANSKQGKFINKLDIEDDSIEYWSRQHLPYFLQSLDRSNCQLKEANVQASMVMIVSTDNSNALLPCQVLEYVPSLQKLSMPLVGTRTTNVQTTHLTELALNFNLNNKDTKLKYNIQQYIQYLIQASPLLQSFSILSGSNIYGVVFDFQRNTQLKLIRHIKRTRDTIKIIQNHREKWYTCCISENSLVKYVLKEGSKKDDDACRFILHLPPHIRSLFLCDYELCLSY